MSAYEIQDYVIDMGPMGPIGEGEALILRVNHNCPWNRCLFCHVYKGKKFSYRNVSEIKRDVDVIRKIVDLIENTSWDIGFQGRINREIIMETARRFPQIYGIDAFHPTQENVLALSTLNNVANWLLCGAKRVFLQDANALIMSPAELVEVLSYIREIFPTVQTITSYARSKTCSRRSLKELQALHEAGLSWVFVGIESGCDDILNHMQKGVKAGEHINGGKKIRAAGIDMAAFVMPGLAGSSAEMGKRHMLETIEVLNAVRPNEVRVRSLAVQENTPLYSKWEGGEFEPAAEDQMIDEIEMLIKGLEFDCIIETLQMTNTLFNIKGRLSEMRGDILSRIADYKGLSPLERAGFRLKRYLYDGYLAFVEGWGKFDFGLSQLVKEAIEGLEKKSNDAPQKIDRAIFVIKSKGVP